MGMWHPVLNLKHEGKLNIKHEGISKFCRQFASLNPHVAQVQVQYALGTARTLEQFWEHCGVNFSTKVISPKACRGGLPSDEAFV